MSSSQQQQQPLSKEELMAREALEKQTALRTATALQHGELPHNAEIDAILDRATNSLQQAQVSGGLSPEGRKIATDATQVIQDVKLVVDEKNRDEHLQKMHLHAVQAAKASYQNAPDRSAFGQVTDKAKSAVDDAMTLARSLVLDAELRTALWELSQIILESFRTQPRKQGEPQLTGVNPQEKPITAATAAATSGIAKPSTGTTVGAGAPPAPPPPPVSFTGAGGSTHTPSPLQQQQPQEEEEEDEDMSAGYHYGPEENALYTGIFLSDEPIPEERLRGVTQRFQRLARGLHTSPERRMAIRRLIDIMTDVGRTGREQVANVVNDANVQFHTQQWTREAQALVESFAMNKSLDPLFNGWRAFVTKTRSDPRFKQYFESLRTFFFKALDDQAFVESPEFRGQLRERLEQGRVLLSEHRALLLNITNELDDFLACLRADDMSKRLADSTTRLARDLFLDDQGSVVFKPSSLAELRKLVVPLVVDQLRYIAIPRIVGSDETMDYAIDNVVFRGQDVLPSHIKISNMNYIDLETRLGGHDTVTSSIYISVSNIQAVLSEISFSYQRKTIPKMSDVGQLDLLIQGRGISIDMWLSSTTEPGRLFRPSRVAVHVHSLKLRNIKAEHAFLYKLLRPVIQNRLRRAVAQAIEQRIAELAVMLDQQMVTLINKTYESAGGKQLDTALDTSKKSEEHVWSPPSKEHVAGRKY